MGSTQYVLLSCLARGSQGKGRRARGEHEVWGGYPREPLSLLIAVYRLLGSHQSKWSLVYSICLCETFLLPALPETQALALLGNATGKLSPHRGLGHGWLGQTFRKGPSE